MAMTEIGEKTLEQEREETQDDDIVLIFQSLQAHDRTNKFLFARISGLENRIDSMLKCQKCGKKFKKIGKYQYAPTCKCLPKNFRLSVG